MVSDANFGDEKTQKKGQIGADSPFTAAKVELGEIKTDDKSPSMQKKPDFIVGKDKIFIVGSESMKRPSVDDLISLEEQLELLSPLKK